MITPTRPPTTVPLMRMNCRSRPTSSSIRRGGLPPSRGRRWADQRGDLGAVLSTAKSTGARHAGRPAGAARASATIRSAEAHHPGGRAVAPVSSRPSSRCDARRETTEIGLGSVAGVRPAPAPCCLRPASPGHVSCWRSPASDAQLVERAAQRVLGVVAQSATQRLASWFTFAVDEVVEPGRRHVGARWRHHRLSTVSACRRARRASRPERGRPRPSGPGRAAPAQQPPGHGHTGSADAAAARPARRRRAPPPRRGCGAGRATATGRDLVDRARAACPASEGPPSPRGPARPRPPARGRRPRSGSSR